MEFAIETFPFSRRLLPADANNIITLLDINQWKQKFNFFLTEYEIYYEIYLVGLRIRATVPSLQLPTATDSSVPRSERGTKLELASKRVASQKIALQLYTAVGSEVWQLDQELVVEGFPFEDEVNLGDRAIGNSSRLAVNIPVKWQAPLKSEDSILVSGAVSAKIYFKKKDDGITELAARIETLELALAGKLTQLPPNVLVGSGAIGGTANQVPLPLAANLGGFGTTNTGIYGSVALSPTTKGGWAGLHFQGTTFNTNYLLNSPTTGEVGIYNASPGAPFWRWFSTLTDFLISQPLRIGTGSNAIKSVRSVAQVIDFTNLPSQGLHTLDIPVPGATVGAYCHVVPTINSPLQGHWTFSFHAVCEVAGTVKLYAKNDWTGALDLSPFWVRILVVEF